MNTSSSSFQQARSPGGTGLLTRRVLEILGRLNPHGEVRPGYFCALDPEFPSHGLDRKLEAALIHSGQLARFDDGKRVDWQMTRTGFFAALAFYNQLILAGSAFADDVVGAAESVALAA